MNKLFILLFFLPMLLYGQTTNTAKMICWDSLSFHQSNPRLDCGMFGFETDKKHFKTGDGVTRWNSLPYILTGLDSSIFATKHYADSVALALSGGGSGNQPAPIPLDSLDSASVATYFLRIADSSLYATQYYVSTQIPDTTSLSTRIDAKVPKTRQLTINGNTQSLEADRTWSVGTLTGSDTTSLSNRINLKVNIADTSGMLLPYLRTVNATTGTVTNITTQSPLTGGAITTTGNIKLSKTSIDSLGTIKIGTWDSTATKIGLASGGTNVSLTNTGGTSQVLKQTTLGGNITVGQLATTDLSDNVAWTDYSATSTITGWASFTTKTIYYSVSGSTVSVQVQLVGTSNSTTTTFTLPYSVVSGSVGFMPYIANAAGTFTATRAYFSGASTITCDRLISGAAFANTGAKEVYLNFSYQK